jgi:hypothetical protein
MLSWLNSQCHFEFICCLHGIQTVLDGIFDSSWANQRCTGKFQQQQQQQHTSWIIPYASTPCLK